MRRWVEVVDKVHRTHDTTASEGEGIEEGMAPILLLLKHGLRLRTRDRRSRPARYPNHALLQVDQSSMTKAAPYYYGTSLFYLLISLGASDLVAGARSNASS